MRFLAMSLLALAVLPATSRAQQSAQLKKQGPTIQAAAVGFRVNQAKVDASTKVSSTALVQRHQGQDVALMAGGGGGKNAGARFCANPRGGLLNRGRGKGGGGARSLF